MRLSPTQKSALVMGYILLGVNSLPIAHAESATVKEFETNCISQEWIGCGFSMAIIGNIDTTTIAEFQQILDKRKAKKYPEGYLHDTVKMNSSGGSVSAAIAIGRLLRKNKISVSIEPNDICVSACVLALAGAAERWVLGRVGIHRPYLTLPKESPPLSRDQVKVAYENVLKEMRAYLREMNVSEKLADDMMLIDPEKVRYLSVPKPTFSSFASTNEHKALDSYGLTSYDPVEKEVDVVIETQKLGISRVEYMRRKSYADDLCFSFYKGNRIIECTNALMRCTAVNLLEAVKCLP